MDAFSENVQLLIYLMSIQENVMFVQINKNEWFTENSVKFRNVKKLMKSVKNIL